jgi:hypothetical protein
MSRTWLTNIVGAFALCLMAVYMHQAAADPTSKPTTKPADPRFATPESVAKLLASSPKPPAVDGMTDIEKDEAMKKFEAQLKSWQAKNDPVWQTVTWAVKVVEVKEEKQGGITVEGLSADGHQIDGYCDSSLHDAVSQFKPGDVVTLTGEITSVKDAQAKPKKETAPAGIPGKHKGFNAVDVSRDSTGDKWGDSANVADKAYGFGAGEKTESKNAFFDMPTDNRETVLIKIMCREAVKGGTIAAATGAASRPAGGGAPTNVIFVVDTSGSMVPAFDEIRTALTDSIKRLKESQRFHVVFYCRDSAIEFGTKQLVPATEENKKKLFLFLADSRAAEYGSSPIPALTAAFRAFRAKDANQDPRGGNCLYLLTDGEFDTGDYKYTPPGASKSLTGNEAVIAWLRNNNKDVKLPDGKVDKEVHIFPIILGDEPDKKTHADMETIAKDNGGKYRYVKRE